MIWELAPELPVFMPSGLPVYQSLRPFEGGLRISGATMVHW